MAEAMAAEEIIQVQFLIEGLLVRFGVGRAADLVHVPVAPRQNHRHHLVAAQFLADRASHPILPLAAEGGLDRVQ